MGSRDADLWRLHRKQIRDIRPHYVDPDCDRAAIVDEINDWMSNTQDSTNNHYTSMIYWFIRISKKHAESVTSNLDNIWGMNIHTSSCILTG